MAIAGDTHAIPSMPIYLGANGRIICTMFSTNKPRELVERDEARAIERLLAGERFQMHCTELQIHRLQCRLDQLRKEEKK